MPSFFSDIELQKISLHELIFHIVGPPDEPVYFDEVILGEGMEGFFVKLVRAAAGGKRFEYLETSGIPRVLSSLVSGHDDFVQISKQLAEGFHEAHKGSSARGVLLFARFSCNDEEYWLLAKYDEMRVIQFEEIEEEGRRRAKLLDINNTLVEDSKSLQKAVLFTGSGEEDDLYIFDRTDRKNVASYLRTWLGVKAHYTPESATSKLKDVLNEVVTATRDGLSESTRSAWRSRYYEIITSREGIDLSDPSERSSFLAEIFGHDFQLTEVQEEVDKRLRKYQLNDEAFNFDKGSLQKPRRSKMKTSEGVEITYLKKLREEDRLIRVIDQEDGKEILIKTRGGVVEDELPD